MKRLAIRTTAAATALCAALVAAVPAFAEDGNGGGTVENLTRHDIEPVVLWSVAGVAAGAVVMGALYKFKRAVGGFPRNPDWIAPITIMPSKDFRGDRDPHEATPPGDDHGHHEAHPTPAHH